MNLPVAHSVQTFNSPRSTRSKGKLNRAKNGPGQLAWAGRPRAFLARFGPIFCVRAPHVIDD
jgi:hypothetical protein